MLLPRCFTAMLQFCNARAARTTMTKECNKAFFHQSPSYTEQRDYVYTVLLSNTVFHIVSLDKLTDVSHAKESQSSP